MKKTINYLIILSIFISVFMTNINTFSYDFSSPVNEGGVNYLKEKIYDYTKYYYSLFETDNPSGKFGSYSGNLCPDGIEVSGMGKFDLDTYVAGVVEHEAYTSEGIEALKAQAIAARTYALNSTNFCKTAIGNSIASQTFNPNPSAKALEAARSTSGQILNYNGKIFSSQYDSFCYEDGDCRDSRNNGSNYTVTYTRIPSGEKHTITLSDGAQFGRIVKGGGHARGMSQLVSYQMAKEGKTYDQILAYFYATGVEIVRPSSSSNWKQTDPAWADIKLGNAKMGDVGCFVTSIAILISKAGISTTLGSDFNPGTFATFLVDNGAFSSDGSLSSFASMSKLISRFGVTTDGNASASNIQNYINQGKYVQIRLKKPNGGTHFVAVDYVDGNDVHISDPGSQCDVLNNCYQGSVWSELRVYTLG